MIIIGSIFLVLGVIIGYYIDMLYNDMMYGVDRNQTTVENAKEIYGVKVSVSYRSIPKKV